MYDLIVWYVPPLQKLPRDHRFLLGERIIGRLYELRDDLILARYAHEKLALLETINGRGFLAKEKKKTSSFYFS